MSCDRINLVLCLEVTYLMPLKRILTIIFQHNWNAENKIIYFNFTMKRQYN